jgi:hypothetical protein
MNISHEKYTGEIFIEKKNSKNEKEIIPSCTHRAHSGPVNFVFAVSWHEAWKPLLFWRGCGVAHSSALYIKERETERFYYVFFNWGVDVKDLGKQKGEK